MSRNFVFALGVLCSASSVASTPAAVPTISYRGKACDVEDNAQFYRVECTNPDVTPSRTCVFNYNKGDSGSRFSASILTRRFETPSAFGSLPIQVVDRMGTKEIWNENQHVLSAKDLPSTAKEAIEKNCARQDLNFDQTLLETKTKLSNLMGYPCLFISINDNGGLPESYQMSCGKNDFKAGCVQTFDSTARQISGSSAQTQIAGTFMSTRYGLSASQDDVTPVKGSVVAATVELTLTNRVSSCLRDLAESESAPSAGADSKTKSSKQVK